MSNITISFDPNLWQELYLSKKYDELSLKMIDSIRSTGLNTVFSLDPGYLRFINNLTTHFLWYISREDFTVPDQYSSAFISTNVLLSNIVAISDIKTTDAYIDLVIVQKNNLVKLLTLYNPYNIRILDIKSLFDANADLASLWFYEFCSVPPFATEARYLQLQNALKNVDERLVLNYRDLNLQMFFSTYCDPENDRHLKSKINSLLQERYKFLHIKNTPNPKKIAIITGKWSKGTAVYKTCSKLIETLKDDYELDLIALGCSDDAFLDKSIFSNIKYISLTQQGIDFSDILENEYIMVYYPDIGMTIESIHLSNLRIAPIQVCSYGHPVSTFGSKIDFWIAGDKIEILEDLTKNYSEKPIVVPGMGLLANYPDFDEFNITIPERDYVLISCSWGLSKFNYPMVDALRKIMFKAKNKVKYRFFPNWGTGDRSQFLSFYKNLEDVLGRDNFELIPDINYENYLTMIGECDIAIDCHPFGGYNTVVDSIFVKKPTLVFESKKAYGRLGSGLMRSLNMEHMIAKSHEEYIEKTVRLVDDFEYRNKIKQELEHCELKAIVESGTNPQDFKNAIDKLLHSYIVEKDDHVKKCCEA